MPDSSADQIAKLQQSIATLEEQQRTLGVDLSASIQIQREVLSQLEQAEADASVTLSGSGTIVQGADNVTANPNGIAIKGDVRDSVISIVNQYLDIAPQAWDRQALYQQVSDYLTWLRESCGTIELRGIKREGQQVVQLDLDTVYVPLSAQSLGKRDDRSIEMDEILGQGERVVITGGPGCGKTTVLLRIAWSLATAIINDNSLLASQELGWQDPVLGGLQATLREADLIMDPQQTDLDLARYEKFRDTLENALQLAGGKLGLTASRVQELKDRLEKARLLLGDKIVALHQLRQELVEILKNANDLAHPPQRSTDALLKQFLTTLKRVDQLILKVEPNRYVLREELGQVLQDCQELARFQRLKGIEESIKKASQWADQSVSESDAGVSKIRWIVAEQEQLVRHEAHLPAEFRDGVATFERLIHDRTQDLVYLSEEAKTDWERASELAWRQLVDRTSLYAGLKTIVERVTLQIEGKRAWRVSLATDLDAACAEAGRVVQGWEGHWKLESSRYTLQEMIAQTNAQKQNSRKAALEALEKFENELNPSLNQLGRVIASTPEQSRKYQAILESAQRVVQLMRAELRKTDQWYEELHAALQTAQEYAVQIDEEELRSGRGLLAEMDLSIPKASQLACRELGRVDSLDRGLSEAVDQARHIVAEAKELLPIPIFAPLSAFASYLRELPVAATAHEHTLAAFLSHYLVMRQCSFNLPADFFQCLMRDGRAVVLLLDGLDEVPNEAERMRVREAIEQLVTGRKSISVVVTCRIAAYQNATALGKGFREVRVKPLGPLHIEALVRQAYACIYRTDPDTCKRKADELLQGIGKLESERRLRLGDTVEPLIASPLLVRMLLVVHFSERRLPEQRAELYLKATDAMLLPEYSPDETVIYHLAGIVGGSREVHREMVQYLAFVMHNRGKHEGRDISEDQLRKTLESNPAFAPFVNNFIALTRLRGTLLEERLGSYRFVHLAFQEYLTARYLAEVKRDVNQVASFLEDGTSRRILDSWWREVILLVAGYLGMTSPEIARQFLLRLGGVDDEAALRNKALPVKVQLVAIRLAVTALLEWQVATADPYSKLAERLAMFWHQESTDTTILSQLKLVGRALQRLGGPFEGRILPPRLTEPFNGPFFYGPEKKKQEIGYPVRFGVYPVTNAQYKEFVDAIPSPKFQMTFSTAISAG